MLNAAELFDWAKKKWPVLESISGLPAEPLTIEVKAAQLGITSSRPTVTVTSSNHEQLRNLYIKQAEELEETKSLLVNCQNQLAQMTTEVEQWREKDKQTRQRRSEAGKKGRGIPRRPK